MKVLNELAGDLGFALLFFEREEQISYLAYYDVMTGLPNRRLFLDRLAQLVHPQRHGTHPLAVVLLNIDRFAQLNDALGRHAGDALLVADGQPPGRAPARGVQPVAHRRRHLRADGWSTWRAARMPARCLQRQRLQRCSMSRSGSMATRCGCRRAPGWRYGLPTAPDADTLFKHAEAALKNARSSGERYLFYAPRMNAALAARLALENELQAALEGQPVRTVLPAARRPAKAAASSAPRR